VNAAAFLARYRVRLGYPLAAAVLVLARPTLQCILYGALVGLLGLFVRGLAAGYLHKQKVLTVTGPYAYTRNPLYFGSALLACGAAIATHSWLSAALLAAYFGLFYTVVMRREEGELRLHHGPAFDEYARAVPLFFPRFTAAKPSAGSGGSFSFGQYKENHEWQAPLGFLFLLALLLLIWRLRMP
jgi:protein-S-isoprenylcysteine O-methyltransferase Ste14